MCGGGEGGSKTSAMKSRARTFFPPMQPPRAYFAQSAPRQWFRDLLLLNSAHFLECLLEVVYEEARESFVNEYL